ncbi:MAG: methionyl-tRNA formyltransferase [Holdemanella sp.]|nr:methionyl-tRNA formyltransferase [Holdemanella sp.]
MKEVHTIFMGTPDIAATILRSLLEEGKKIDLVVTQPDKKKGRKQILEYSPVKQVAMEYDIPVFQPIKIRDDYQRIVDCKPDLIITCAYGQIVTKEVLDCATYGCVNLHGSILPKYRGGAPIQRAIWNGDTKSGMTLMKMVERMDAGPVLDVEEVEILPQDNSTSVFEKMAVAASKLMLKNFDLITSGNAIYTEQDESKVIFSPVIKKEEEHLDYAQNDEGIINQIRALSYQPGAYCLVKNKKLKILEATYVKENIDAPYTIVGWKHDGFAISLKEGTLVIKECQMEGKPVMKAKDFFNGQGRNLVNTIIE